MGLSTDLEGMVLFECHIFSHHIYDWTCIGSNEASANDLASFYEHSSDLAITRVEQDGSLVTVTRASPISLIASERTVCLLDTEYEANDFCRRLQPMIRVWGEDP